MRCISCIGNDQVEEFRFCRNDQEIITDLVHEAVCHFWHPDEMILLIRDPNHAYIAAECESRGIPLRKLWIPEGIGGDNLWETFTLLGDIAGEREEILFDITGGCHALPFIISLVATYLIEIKHVRIIGVVYATTPDEHSMRHFVDLKPLMGVIDWISGVKTLSEFTDATRIQTLLTRLQGDLHRTDTGREPPTHLKGWAHLLGSFTSAVHLNRPVDALYAGWGITKDIPVVRDELNRFAPALTPMMEEIHTIREMAAPPPGQGITPQYLMMQHNLIRYQIRKGLDVQAASLSREWLISGTMILLGNSDRWQDAEVRHTVSRTLTGLALTLQGVKSETTKYSHLLLEITGWRNMVGIWERVSDLRNDLAHCGMNERDESLKSLLKRTARLPDELLEFAQICDIIPDKTDEKIRESGSG